MNVYAEYAVQVKPKFRQLLLRNLLILAGILFIVFSPVLYYTFVFGFTSFVLAYYYNKHLKQEYEYIIYDDDFAIYRIVNKLKRKKIESLNLQSMVVFTDQASIVNEYRTGKYRDRPVRRRNYRNPKYKPYMLVVSDPDRTECLIINASPEMAAAFLARFPHQTKLSEQGLELVRSVSPSSNVLSFA